MTEEELLQRTRDLVRQAHLPTTMELGETWIIVLAASPILPPSATERYEAALTELKSQFPAEVVDFAHAHRSGTARYMLLRAGGKAIAHWMGKTA